MKCGDIDGSDTNFSGCGAGKIYDSDQANTSCAASVCLPTECCKQGKYNSKCLIECLLNIENYFYD